MMEEQDLSQVFRRRRDGTRRRFIAFAVRIACAPGHGTASTGGRKRQRDVAGAAAPSAPLARSRRARKELRAVSAASRSRRDEAPFMGPASVRLRGLESPGERDVTQNCGRAKS